MCEGWAPFHLSLLCSTHINSNILKTHVHNSWSDRVAMPLLQTYRQCQSCWPDQCWVLWWNSQLGQWGTACGCVWPSQKTSHCADWHCRHWSLSDRQTDRQTDTGDSIIRLVLWCSVIEQATSIIHGARHVYTYIWQVETPGTARPCQTLHPQGC